MLTLNYLRFQRVLVLYVASEPMATIVLIQRNGLLPPSAHTERCIAHTVPRYVKQVSCDSHTLRSVRCAFSVLYGGKNKKRDKSFVFFFVLSKMNSTLKIFLFFITFTMFVYARVCLCFGCNCSRVCVCVWAGFYADKRVK